MDNAKPHFTCEACGKSFTENRSLNRHVQNMHYEGKDHGCSLCDKKFSRKDALLRHQSIHKRSNIDTQAKRRKVDASPSTVVIDKCNWCTQTKSLASGKKFCRDCGLLGRECKWCHRPLPERFYGRRTDVCDRCLVRRDNWKNRQQSGGAKEVALNDTAQTVTLDTGSSFDCLQFLKDNESQISNVLLERLESVRGIKWFITLFVRFVKYNQNNEAVFAEPIFRSINFTCTNVSEIENQLASAFQHVHTSFQIFERDGSGWSIDKILKLEISTVEFKPLEGSSYIPLPSKIRKKKAVLNIMNDDQQCFIYSVLAALHPVSWYDNPNRVSHYKQYVSDLNLAGIESPTPLSQINKFEQQNNVSVNVFGLEGKEVYPLQITQCRDMRTHVNLLLFSKGETRHYCLIRNLSRLLGDRTKHEHASHYCNYCLHGFSTEALLLDHVPFCSPHGPQKLSFPKSEDKQWVRFNNVHKQLPVPFVVYADFESFVKPIDLCHPDPSISSTTKYQKHEPSGYSFMVKCTSDELSKTAQVYRGPNVIDHFFESLLKEEEEICQLLENVKPMKLKEEEEASFQAAKLCHICDKDLGADKVRDHDHLNGSFRGAAHSNCNLQYKFRRAKRSYQFDFYIPVIFHNLRGYDLHLLMESAGKFKSKPLTCIPNSAEQYISFSLGNLRFIDSFQFLNDSLETLVSNLAKENNENFHNLARHFPDKNQFHLLIGKGVYPYDYVTSPDVFIDNRLPSREKFYNQLNESDLSEEDYERAQKVWKTFGMTNFGQFHDLYLCSDVLLLADVFENFRSLCLQSYHLDPAHYFTTPNFAWDAMLKKTDVHLQLLDDIEMHLMVERGIRGGLSMVNKKYAKANNPQAPDYNSTLPNTWITYLDMTNLYGTVMGEHLPERDFYWLNDQEIEQLDVTSMADDAETGYILEVDLEVPDHLHEHFNDYPLAVETIEVTNSMLSDHCSKLKEKLKMKGKSAKKLVPNLMPKHRYVVHYRNLKYYMSQGLVLKNIHRVIGFTQSAWLKSYIDFNTEKRKRAQTDFEKDFFKLLNNAVFGKLMENMRKRLHVELVNTPKRLRKVCAKPNFRSFKIFNPDLVGVNLKKTNIVLNRPIYAGFCVLDLSKLLMQQFHYDFIKAKYGQKAQLLYTDTDSLTYEIETSDWYQDMADHIHLFDTSNFRKDSPLYSTHNCKVLGKMKDECGGKIIEEFVGLKPKMYSMRYGFESLETDEDGNEVTVWRQGEIKRAKGVKKIVVKKQLKHEIYLNCLMTDTCMKHTMNAIRSESHQLYSITLNKTSLSPFDDKRYFTGIDSLAYGHHKILNV